MRGIYIFDVRTVEEAQKMVETDPSIKAGLFEVEMRPWFGTAALLEVLKIHEKITEEALLNDFPSDHVSRLNGLKSVSRS